ncbi:MAG: hypothetical protein GC186_12540 [Rhodobacteraceae bacterium]|nr:hypothetical protein [Paracoccaceae bacterium]
MKKPLLAALVLTLALGACSGFRQSRMNPFNWFGGSKKAAPVAVDPATGVALAPADTRDLVAEVETLVVERRPGGAIIRATGLAPTQGWWNAALAVENDGKPVKGVLTYRFVISPPLGATPVSTPQSREVTVAIYLSDAQMDGVTQITVTGLNNARSSRR